jgi:tRNA(Ile)-lysidine synthase
MSPSVSQVEEALRRSGMLPAGCGCVIAVSGGRDSMVLLALLGALRTSWNWRLTVAHFHHRLRGAEADADRDLVREAGAAAGLPVVVGEGDVRGSRQRGESLEAGARRLRHRFLAEVARDAGAGWIATGHHDGDQVELFLLRLLRGAGGSGLGGMGEIDPSPADPGVRLARPLLTFASTWVTAAARELSVAWREDGSNRDRQFLRNRIRHELIPLLEEGYQPALATILGRTRVVVRDEAVVSEAWAARWLGGEDRQAFAELPVAVQRVAIRRQLDEAKVTPGFDLIERLRQLPGVAVQVNAGRRVVREPDGRLRVDPSSGGPGDFLTEEMRVPLRDRSGQMEFGGARFHWAREEVRASAVAVIEGRGEHSEAEAGVESGWGRECFDARAVGGSVRLRHWRPGDRFAPIGLGAEARLQDLFTNAGVPADERRRRVVAEAEDGRLFWVEGLRIGERAKRTPGTAEVLVWRWRRVGVAG